VSSGGASNLYVGTYLPGDGTIFGLKRALGFRATTPQTRVLDRVAERHPGRDREEALRAAARDNVDRYVVGDPVGFAGLAVRKVDRLWLGYTLGTHHNPRAAVTTYHLVLVVLSAVGLLAGLLRARDPALVVLYVTAVNIVLVSEARHNLPVMGVLVAGGTAGLVLAAHRLPRSASALRPGGLLKRS
jgi:hypothetical protein